MSAAVLSSFLRMQQLLPFHKVNEELAALTGIRQYFHSQEEWERFRDELRSGKQWDEPRDRSEFGDFQTPLPLAVKIVELIAKDEPLPAVMIEPTCGKGHFIIAALQQFPSLQTIYALDIYEPWLWQTKFSVTDHFLQHPHRKPPAIILHQRNIFDFDFEKLAIDIDPPLLILGNPPWVTNAMLGSLDSSNLPEKSNFKQHEGIAAVTGKGNFDIAENITLMLLKAFHTIPGRLALLVKNSVIRNIVAEQHRHRYPIGEIGQYQINSLKEFEVKAEASLFTCRLDTVAAFTCRVHSFYKPSAMTGSFGWVEDKFVSNTTSYIQYRNIEGNSSLEWRQGLKHDCSPVMELERTGGSFLNARHEEFRLEADLVYGLLKSSDLQQDVVSAARKYTIVTQQRPGADTLYIREKFPATWDYLHQHRELFDNRRSSIYKNKPLFSIFGIGEYSFKPYKVAISGLYKSFRFALVLPHEGKPLMLDDTCYMLGFDDLGFAVFTFILLNSAPARDFLASITFADAKRTFTKEVLMRIDLLALAKGLSASELEQEIQRLNNVYGLQVGKERWTEYFEWLAG
ncbi:MAG: hypothetical protein J7578_06000 [Chitinophagaceae bacterium]|nr:hypothetical protein [Chitinophagaceae bacterium]